MNALPLVDLARVRPDGASPTLRQLTHIIMAAHAEHAGLIVSTDVRCRRRPERRRCGGWIQVRRQDVPEEIHWCCPVCGDGGVALHWRATSWHPERLAAPFMTPSEEAG